jgi:hypothetical protein
MLRADQRHLRARRIDLLEERRKDRGFTSWRRDDGKILGIAGKVATGERRMIDARKSDRFRRIKNRRLAKVASTVSAKLLKGRRPGPLQSDVENDFRFQRFRILSKRAATHKGDHWQRIGRESTSLRSHASETRPGVRRDVIEVSGHDVEKEFQLNDVSWLCPYETARKADFAITKNSSAAPTRVTLLAPRAK